MNSDNEKISAFLDSINRDAQARCKQIKQEADRYVMQELGKARQHAHKDVQALKKTETDRLNEEANAGFSELEAGEKKKLIERRAEITNEVFSKAKAKLSEFAGSAEYIGFLKKSIGEIKSAVGDDCVIFIKPDDRKYEAELSPLCQEIKYDSSIEIGGCKAENTGSRMAADDTLDARLEAKKADFYKTSGLSITV